MHQLAATGGGGCDMARCTADVGHWNSSPHQLLQDRQCSVSNKTAVHREACRHQHWEAQPQPLPHDTAALQPALVQQCAAEHNSSSSSSSCSSPNSTKLPIAADSSTGGVGPHTNSSSSDESSSQQCTSTHSGSSELPTSTAGAAAAATDREADGCWFEGGLDPSALDSSDEESMIDEGSWASSSDAGSSSDAFSDVGDPAATEVVYVRESVGVWPSRSRRILGRLSLVKQHGVLFMAWLPYNTTPAPALAGAAAAPAAAPAAPAAAPVAGAAASAAAAANAHGSITQAGAAANCHVVAAVVDGNAAEAPAVVAADAFCDSGQAVTELQQQQQSEDVPVWVDGAAEEGEAVSSSSSCIDHHDVAGTHQPSDLLPVPIAAPWPQQQQQQQQRQQQRRQRQRHQQQQQASLGATAGTGTPAAAEPTCTSMQYRQSLCSLYAIHPVPLSDIKAFVKHTPPLSCQHITVVLNSGLTLPPLYFHNGGLQEFIATLNQHACLVRAAADRSTYLVNDTADPLQRCLVALDVADIMLGGPPSGTNWVQAPADQHLAAAAAAAGGTAGVSSSSTGSRGRLPGAAAAAAGGEPAAAAAAAALPQLPWGGFGVGYAGASTAVMPATAFQHGGAVGGGGAAAAAAAAVAAAAEATSVGHAAVRNSFNISTRGMAGARPAALAGFGPNLGPDWGSTLGGVLGSTLSMQLTTTLSRVGQLALEGASTLVAAAVESWHAETMHHFEHEVDFRPDWGEQSLGQQVTRLQTTQQTQGPQVTPAQQHDSSSSSSSSVTAVSSRALQQPSSAPGSIAALVAAAAASPITAAATTTTATGRQSSAHPQQQQQLSSSSSSSNSASAPAGQPMQSSDAPATPAATAAASSWGTSHPGSQSVPGPQCSSSAADVDTSLGSFELLEGVVPDQLTAVLSRAAPPPLSAEELSTCMDCAGVLVDEAGFAERVFQAGIEPSARREAWKFLLGVYPAGSSAASRQQLRIRQEQQYAALRSQWGSIGQEQAKHWATWRERRSGIDKDVRRTDRFHPFYRGRGREAVRHLTSLRDVLRCYCLYNWDVGYCQGMSDLASPLLVVMEGDEVDAFWSFVGLMERLSCNFSTTQAGMHGQLCALRQLVQVLDPQLHAFFETRDCLNYFFAFRWLLIHFKREFPFEQVLSLWEACWSCSLTPHLHLYLAAAVLIQHRRLLLADETLDFDGVLRFCVELAGKLDLHSCLRLAEALALIAGQTGTELLQGLP